MENTVEERLKKTVELLFHAKKFLQQAQENLQELRKEAEKEREGRLKGCV